MKKLVTILILIVPVCVHAQWGTVTGATTNYRSTFTGNLGIGTGTSTVPADKLEVVGNIRSNQFNAINGIFNVPNTTTNLSLRTNNVARLTILNGGNVGINMTNPTHALEVQGTIRVTHGIILNTIPLVSSQWTTATTQLVGQIYVPANINYTGNGVVSIGTTAAPNGYKLAVAGKIITEEIVVKLQQGGVWPDYVFGNRYNLMPLSELELFINKNKHLPEVPSAEQVAANGIAVGEMNATLLKKIEELTLYVIELKKENEKQQVLLNALAEQVKK